MTDKLARKIVEVSMSRAKADLCLKNANVVDVYNKTTFLTDVYIVDGYFAAFKGPIEAK